MTSTHLITQAVVAGLQGQIDSITNQLGAANSDLASAIQGLINSLNTAYSTVRLNLESHTLENYATVHGGATSAQVTYLDSAANIVGDYVVGVNIGGTQLWLPASTAQDGVCHSQCHSACNCTCEFWVFIPPLLALAIRFLVPVATGIC